MVLKIDSTLTGILDGDEGLDLFYATTGGIGNAQIRARGGQNIVIGNNTARFGSGIGILNTSISSTGSLTTIANGSTIGMAATSIAGGDGVDNIIARGSLFGVVLVSIDGGGGGDTFDLQSGTGTVDGGSGIDTLILEGDRADYTFTAGSGLSGLDNISSADGTDLDVENIEQFLLNGVEYTFDDLFGGDEPTPPPPEQGEIISRRQIVGQTVEGTDLSDSYEATQSGIQNSTFETLGGNDSITSFSQNASAILFTQIDTGDGDDTVSAETQGGAQAAINFSEINTGAGDDTVIATNSADSGGAIGIDDQVTINTGDGNDTIIADAEGFPILNPTILTGAGNDTIELRGGNDGLNNGFGTIDGGSGDEDLLILGGNSANYLYELEDSTTLQGNISTGFGNTGLDITGVEFFQFAGEPDTTYAFDELFTGEVFGVGGFVWDDLNSNGLQDSGEPGIEGVQVGLQNTLTGETLETTTDADGLYLFENPDVSQQYRVAFSSPEGFDPTEFRVNGGANPDIDSDAIPLPFAQDVQVSPGFLLDAGVLFDVDAGYTAVV